jgi:8-oxo-dGTP pyrophosphatase MutT (NUDIX family)
MKWEKLSEKMIYENKYFKIREERCAIPGGKIVPAYYVIDLNNWVNIVAVTKDKKIILIEQYRHALGDVTIEIPGGAVDTNEDPRGAAVRELLEETGYRGDIILEKQHMPNPALQTNCMWTYLFINCEKVSEQNLDEYEVVKVSLCSFSELSNLFEAGKIKHSLILASLFLVWKDLQNQINE